MAEQSQYFAVKAMFPAEDIEIAHRIEWCKESDIEFFNISIMGTKVGNVFYEAAEMKEIGILILDNDDGGSTGEINLATLPPKNIGMGFVFHNEIDAAAFKLRWI